MSRTGMLMAATRRAVAVMIGTAVFATGANGLQTPEQQRRFQRETQIRVLAERALAGPTDPGVLRWGAIGLALLVGGPDLRSEVEEMAASDEEVRKRLFVPTEPWRWSADYEAHSIDWIRKEAAYLLADPKRTPYYRRPGCQPDRAFPKPPLCPVN